MMCTKISMDDFYTVHHEMGHIEYYMAYREGQPFCYRDAPTSGFHEAIGDSIALSVMTPEHLHAVGLLDEMPHSDGAVLHSLLFSFRCE